jgi:chemotaxis family two-component system sensor kinase Cph1
MSISIMVRGRLWGMISCHHASPLTPSIATRSLCEHVGQIVSLQIDAHVHRLDAEYRLDLRRTLVHLLSYMTRREDMVAGLSSSPQDLLRFTSSRGAAIVFEARVSLVGETPDEDTVRRLADWLAGHSSRDVYATDHLGAEWPEAARCADVASGLLAISISQIYRNYVFWFRPEIVRTIEWAGDPRAGSGKDALSGDAAPVGPRRSFAAWRETVRDRSLPWQRSEIDTAAEFRTAVLGIVLRRAEEMAALASELGRANKELEAFSYSVSHDLRAPLRHIVGYGDLLREYEGGNLSERGRRFLKNIVDAARFAGALVDDLLTFSQMGRAALRPSRVDMNALVSRVIGEMELDAAGRSIEWQVGALPEVIADPAFLQLAVRNLLSNAIKYTRTREHAVVEIGALAGADETVFFVRDNGVGFNMKYVGKLFGVFQRLHRLEEFEGTGIGLANVRRIVERHDGRTWAEGRLDEGAAFFFALPRRGSVANAAGVAQD